MLTTKQDTKFSNIEADYINGNQFDARQGIKKLNKLELALFMTFYNNAKFHNFIINGIDVHYDNNHLLCTAVMNNNLKLTSLLLSLNANISARKNFSITIIDFWISCGYSNYIPMQNLLKNFINLC